MNIRCSLFSDVQGAISIRSTDTGLSVIRCIFNSCILDDQSAGGAIYFSSQGYLTIKDTTGINCQCTNSGQFLFAKGSAYSENFGAFLERVLVSECKHVVENYGHTACIRYYQSKIRDLNCSKNKNFFEPGFFIECTFGGASVSYSIFNNLEATCYVILSFRTDEHLSVFDHCSVTNCKEPTNIYDYDPGMVHSTGKL